MQGYYNIQISFYCLDIPRSYVSIFRYFVIYKYFISDSKIQTFFTVQTFLIHTFQYSNISLYDIYISYLIHKIQIFLNVSFITSNVQIFRYTNISYLIHKIQTFLTVSSITFNVQIFRYTNISYLIHKIQIYCLIHNFQRLDISLYKYFISDSQSFRFTILYSNLQGYYNIQTFASIYSNVQTYLSLYKYFISDSQNPKLSIRYFIF